MKTVMQLHAYLEGTVQGVGMRFYVQHLANQLGIKGYVKNLPDGRVFFIAEGKKEQLEVMLEKIEKSPRGDVKKVSCKWHSKVEEYSTFEIRY